MRRERLRSVVAAVATLSQRSRVTLVACCVGAREAASADAHAFRVVPAAGSFAGRAARTRRYAAPLPPAAATRPPPSRLRGRGAPREHRSLRACRLPRVFILNPRAPVLCQCVRSLWCGGLTCSNWRFYSCFEVEIDKYIHF